MSFDPFYKTYRDEDGQLHAYLPGGPACDFCLTPFADVREAWTYPAAPMPVVGHPVITDSPDDWAACEICHKLIEAKRLGALVEWALAQQERMAPEGTIKGDHVVTYPPMAIRRRRFRENLLRFFDARTGPPYQGPPPR